MLLSLNGKWKMKRTDENNWIDAVVPGSVYNDLLKAGRIEDPFYRENEHKVFELSKYDYEYERSFKVDMDMLTHDKVLLLCEGLDTLCEVFINNKSVLNASNMHRTYEIDIKALLVQGENIIHVVFKSPVEYVTKKQAEIPLVNSDDAIEGISHLRKAHYMFGWDWGPKLPDMGIWRNISIRTYDSARIDDVYISQKHEKSKVELDVRVRLQKWNDNDVSIVLKIKSPEGRLIETKLAAELEENHISVNIDNPELWWPNNLGKQPLYNVEVILLKDNIMLDNKNLRIGLRTLTVKQDKDKWGQSFQFEVNGVSIFAMGADYVPEDNILARCNRKKTEKLIKNCIAANFNSIRVWGGAFYPEDYFYELCDEYGLIVWQDLMFACGVYNFTEEFKENVKREVIDNMKRLRHHAALGLWCGNNEQEVAWGDWGWTEKCAPKLKADYIKQYEVMLPELAKEIDPNTFYWLASPSSTGSFYKPNDENYGDMHYWGVWHGKEPFTAYRNIFPRFMSEFGIQSFPCSKTINAFTEPKDRNIFSYVMEAHQKNGSGNEKILYYVGENYKYPKDFDSLVYVSQLNQAEGLRYGVEHWRRNRGRCMGAIYWQLNDCWPVASWASIDYYGRWKALHYAAKKFFSPLLISACEEGTKVSFNISNETMRKISGKISWRLMDNASNVIEKNEKEVEINAFTSSEFENIDFSTVLDLPWKKRNCYLEYSLIVDNKIASSGTVLFVKSKHFEFLNPNIKSSILEEEDKFIIDICSVAFARFVELDLENKDIVFSDNFFDLSAGDVKRVEVLKDNISLNDMKNKLKIRSLYDSF